jgi:hypothetical protein
MQRPNVKEQLEGLGAVIAADRGTPGYLARLAPRLPFERPLLNGSLARAAPGIRFNETVGSSRRSGLRHF